WDGSCRSGSAAAAARSAGSANESVVFPAPSPSAASSYDESLQEMSAQETSAELRLSAQLTSLQEMSAQETAASAESPQETSPQDTASQETFALAVSDQLTALKAGMLPPDGSAPRNWSSALFGFGTFTAVTDLTALTSPRPSDP